MKTRTSTEILRATGRALRQCRYADPTMKRLAGESSMSTVAIHHPNGTGRVFETYPELWLGWMSEMVE